MTRPFNTVHLFGNQELFRVRCGSVNLSPHLPDSPNEIQIPLSRNTSGHRLKWPRGIGVDRSYISDMERGKKNMCLPTLV